jgi:hypothetical protein
VGVGGATVNSMARSVVSTSCRGDSHRNASATSACNNAASAAAVGDMRLNFE